MKTSRPVSTGNAINKTFVSFDVLLNFQSLSACRDPKVAVTQAQKLNLEVAKKLVLFIKTSAW